MSIEVKCENRGASTKISTAIRLPRLMGNKGSQNCLSEFLAAKEMDGTMWRGGEGREGDEGGGEGEGRRAAGRA